LTVGQRFDLADTAIEVISRGFGGGSKGLFRNPLNWMTGTTAALDVGISSGTARKGNLIGAGVSAAGAEVAAAVGYTTGAAAGSIIGSFILPIIGTEVGAIVGGGIGSLVSDRKARTAIQKLYNFAEVSRPRVRFGGNFKDSQPAYTMRQKAEQELGASLLNARRYLGREAQLMHQ
jgi:hypothetical protein